MKKTTLKTYLITLLVLLLSFALMITAFACNKTEDETEEEPKSEESSFTSLVSNGDFSSFSSGSTQPYSPSSWSTYTPSGYSADDKVAGIIDTGADYDKNKSEWGDAPNPFGEVTENKVLMIYNKELNAYGYSNTFTTSSYGFYKVSVKVKVVDAEGGGATFRISSNNGFEEFSAINNTNAFTEYTFYLESPAADSSTITVWLTLGYADKHVKGYAFFDDVVAEKITKKDYTDAKAGDTIKIVSMLYPDGEFNYYSYSSATTVVQTPSSWTWTTGSNVGGKSLPTSDRYTGIISASDKETWDGYSIKYGEYPNLPVADSADKNILMIEKKQTSNSYSPTAGYYSSKSKIRIDRDTLYKISVWVKATVDEDESVTNYANKGARVVLDGTDKKESDVINSASYSEKNNGWAEVIFYVLGNQFRSQDFTIQLWLGNDKNNDTLVQGAAFFDKLTINVVDTGDKTRDQIADDCDAKVGTFDSDEIDHVSYVKFFNLATEDEKLIANDNFNDLADAEAKYTFKAVDNVIAGDDVIVNVIPTATLDSEAAWTVENKAAYGIDANPLYPYSYSPVLVVYNKIPCAYRVERKDTFEIKQSLSYRISVWIKTVDLEKEKNITLKLVDEEGAEVDDCTFSINTTDYTNDLTNNYAEYCFYLTGSMAVLPDTTTDNSHYVRIVITNGSGTTYDPSSYQKGGFLVANINMEEITYTEYTNASSGTYAKKKDYTSNSATVTNGNFNSYDREKTTFDDEGFVKITDKDDNTHLVGALSSWTNNVDSTFGSEKINVLEDTENQKATKTQNLSLTKAADNAENKVKFDLSGRTISTVRITGPAEFDKTFETESEWSKYLDINVITGLTKWKSNTEVTELTDGDYTVYVTTDEKIVNKLIAGIINVNNSQAYFDQFGINRETIFDKWSDNTIEKAVTFGAPNLLMITTRDAYKITLKNTFVGEKATNDKTATPAVKSSSFSLDGSSYYRLKCYAKTLNGAIGQVYLTTTNTSTAPSYYTIEDTDGWVEYIFLVETGLSSVSAQFEIYYGVKGDADTEYSGTLLLDSFSYTKIDEDIFANAPESTAKSKFTTITFDTTNKTADDLAEAIAPSGFSGSNSNSDERVAGIIARKNFAYTDNDGNQKLGIYESKTEKDEDGNEKTTDVLIDGSWVSDWLKDDEAINKGMDDGDTVGDYLLMINNRKEGAFTYSTSSSLTLDSDSYYKFTVYVRTDKIASDKSAKVYVSITDEPISFSVNTEYDAEGNEIENKWKKLTFYFKNEKTTSVSANLYFQLGEDTDGGKLTGYLFVDNISLSKVDKDEYDSANEKFNAYVLDEKNEPKLNANGEKILTAEAEAYRENNVVTELTEDETTETTDENDNDEEEEEKSSLNTTLLWTYITSIAIAVVLIAVIVVWLIKKYRKPKTASAAQKKADYDRTNAKSDEEEVTSTGSARDQFKDDFKD